jgi:hypothetical protein
MRIVVVVVVEQSWNQFADDEKRHPHPLSSPTTTQSSTLHSCEFTIPYDMPDATLSPRQLQVLTMLISLNASLLRVDEGRVPSDPGASSLLVLALEDSNGD